MDYQNKYDDLINSIGKENVEFNYYTSDANSFFPSNIRVEYLPTGKFYFGETSNNQLENAVGALEKLKKDLKNIG